MQYLIFAAAAFAIVAVATPTAILKRQNDTGLNPNIVFTNDSCTLSTRLYQPPYRFIPTPKTVEELLGPNLAAAVGQASVDDIGNSSGDICVSAGADSKAYYYQDGRICSNIIHAMVDLGLSFGYYAEETPDKYRCLINAICVAQQSPANTDRCRLLLAGTDCIASRIAGDDGAAACNGNYGPY